MLKALEPRTKGPQMTPEREIKALEAEKRALEKELRRHQTLLRAAHRSVGLPARKKKVGSSKGRVRAKRGSRGKTVLETLRKVPDADGGVTDGKAKRDGDAGGEDRGESGGA